MKQPNGLAMPRAWMVLLLLLLWATKAIASLDDVMNVIEQIPRSAEPCIFSAMQGFNCSFSALADCFCTDTAVLANVSSCIQHTSPFSEQIQVARASTELCKGFPIESRSSEVKIAAITCAALTFPIVFLRCVARLTVSTRLWLDDWLAVLSSLVLAAIIGIEIKGSEVGFGRHYWNVNPIFASLIFEIFYALQLLYVVAQVTAKGSLIAFYYRIFPTRKFRMAVWAVAVFLVTHGVVYLGLLAFQCLPLVSIWDKNVTGKCINLTATGYSGAACSIIEDFVIMLMPIPELLKLNLNNRKKAALVFMFSLGSFACVTSMVRLRYLIAFANTLDPSWDNIDLVVWSVIELSCALICASLPALRPLLRKIPEALSSIASSTNKALSSGGNSTPGSAPLGFGEEKPRGRFKELPPLPPEAYESSQGFRDSSRSGRQAGQDIELQKLCFKKDKNDLPTMRASMP